MKRRPIRYAEAIVSLPKTAPFFWIPNGSDVKTQSIGPMSESPFGDSVATSDVPNFRFVPFDPPPVPKVEQIHRFFDRKPFDPSDDSQRQERCKEIFAIQTAGLAKRMEHTNMKKLVIGVSGGLDSTLALLVWIRHDRPHES